MRILAGSLPHPRGEADITCKDCGPRWAQIDYRLQFFCLLCLGHIDFAACRAPPSTCNPDTSANFVRNFSGRVRRPRCAATKKEGLGLRIGGTPHWPRITKRTQFSTGAVALLINPGETCLLSLAMCVLCATGLEKPSRLGFEQQFVGFVRLTSR